MKKIFLGILFISITFLSCAKKISVPESFDYREVSVGTYNLAVWQKISDNISPVRIYIEGDGNAFNSYGYPSNDPTPKNIFLREIAFNDPNKNVIYLARPGQYVKNKNNKQTDWTTGRFSEEIVNSMSTAIKELAGKRGVILVGYSGGALLSGLIINGNKDIKVIKWITIAGVLNHKKWTEMLKLPPLKDSLDLEYLPKVKQVHLAGEKDKIVPIELIKEIVPKKDLIIIPSATHSTGYEEYYSIIYNNDI